MPRPVLALAALALIVVPTGACSSETAPPSDYDAAVVRDGLAALFAGDHPEEEDAEAATCFADELSDSTTPEELREAGILDHRFDVVAELPPLSRSMADAWVAAQFACTDFVEASTRAQVQVTKGAIDATAYAACLREALDERAQREAVSALLTGDLDAPAVETLSRAQADCSAQTT